MTFDGLGYAVHYKNIALSLFLQNVYSVVQEQAFRLKRQEQCSVYKKSSSLCDATLRRGPSPHPTSLASCPHFHTPRRLRSISTWKRLFNRGIVCCVVPRVRSQSVFGLVQCCLYAGRSKIRSVRAVQRHVESQRLQCLASSSDGFLVII